MLGTRRRVGLLLALLVAALLVPVRAEAHAHLERAVPARDARLDSVPTALRLVFSEAVEAAVSQLHLVTADGDTIALGPLGHPDGPDGARVLTATIVGELRSGRYRVIWAVAGRDGHPVHGEYGFEVAPGAVGLPAPVVRDTAAASPPATSADSAARAASETAASDAGFTSRSPGYVAIRWALFGALLAVLGAVAFRVVILGRLAHDAGGAAAALGTAGARAATIGAVAAVVLCAVAAARLAAQGAALEGSGLWAGPVPVRRMLVDTVWGWGWLLQVGAAIVALLGFLVARRGRGAGWAVAAVGAALLCVTPALSGHAAAARPAWLAVIFDTLHVLGAGAWLGTLLVVVTAGVAAARSAPDVPTAAVALVRAFSPVALACAALVALTGVGSAWLELGTLPALWGSAYGRTLLLKLGAVVLVAAVGAYNWRRAQPRLARDGSAASLRRTAGAELGLAVVVLLLTAVLVATPTPHEEAAGPASVPQAYQITAP